MRLGKFPGDTAGRGVLSLDAAAGGPTLPDLLVLHLLDTGHGYRRRFSEM